MAKSSSGTGRSGGGGGRTIDGVPIRSGKYGEGVEYYTGQDASDARLQGANVTGDLRVVAAESQSAGLVRLETSYRDDTMLVKPTTGVSDRQVSYANSVKVSAIETIDAHIYNIISRARRSNNTQLISDVTGLRNELFSSINNDTSARHILDTFASAVRAETRRGDTVMTTAMRTYGFTPRPRR